MSNKAFFAILLSLAPACASGVDDPEAAPSVYASALTPGDAALVLDLVNHPDTDAVTLDDVIGLDSRAVEGIVEHRAGTDGEFPSTIDDFFDDLAELDAIPYVGDAAFQKLLAFARANPVAPAQTAEGVTFQGWQAEAILWGVNSVSFAVLDGMMDERAAENLVAKRPFFDMAQVAAVPYVGKVVLERLQDQSASWWADMTGGPSLAGTFDDVTFDHETAVVALEIANQASHTQMVDAGMPSTGSAAIVGNRPYANLAMIAAVSGVGPATMRGLRDYALSGTWSPSTSPTNECVFGLRYRDIFTNGGTIVVAKRVLDPSSSTNATQRAQIVAAVRVAYEDVTTVSGAFAAVDESEINHLEIWDASSRVAYTAYEYGAGDNSYGAVFAFGGTTVAARINDGDLMDCTAFWGDEMRPCERTVDCADGLTCHGTSEDVSTGRCMDLAAPEHASNGAACVVESGCPAASGLVCAGAPTHGDGTCVPAWMRGHFESGLTGDTISQVAGLSFELPVYGLASVDTDVQIDLVINHTRRQDVRVHLTNPAGAEVIVYDGTALSGTGEIYLKDHVIHGFSGDEQVNGLWTIRVNDVGTGTIGMLTHFALTVTSRWD